MKLRVDRNSPIPIHQQLREQLQAALHVGQLRPGDRLPSLREMARRNGVNPKTVLRAYRALQESGLVEVRPGSGAVIGGETIERPDQERALALLRLARRHRSEALAAGLAPKEHRFLLAMLDPERDRDEFRGKSRLRLVFIECSGELSTLSAREITHRLKVRTFPLVLPATGESSEAILRMADLWVTTEFHYEELRPRAKEQGRPCLTVRLDPRFAEAIVGAARRGKVIMVHPDPSIVPAFLRALANTGVPKETLGRVRGVAAANLEMLRRRIAAGDSIYVSPLCPQEVRALAPIRALIPVPRWTIAASSIDALRAMILTFPIMPRPPATSRV